MDKQTNWAKNILTWVLVLMGLGVVVAIAGFILPYLVNGIAFPAGSVIGASIVLLMMGIAGLAQYIYVRLNPKAGQSMMINESDERMQMIRARAGQRAYKLSGALAFAVLIYFSFAGDVGLPELSGYMLFFSLLAVVVIPAFAYTCNIVIEQSHS
jgi:hypothetical protein